MDIEFDPAKRAATLEARDLDFADATELFDGRTLTRQDNRRDYVEPRFIAVGRLRNRFVALVWTPRGEVRRIISMRYGHEREEPLFDLD